MNVVNKNFIAHTRQDEQGHWLEAHSLEDHLRSVAKTSESLASTFDSKNWGRLAGQWHDLGKYQDAFQSYIREKSGYERENSHIEQGVNRVTHSTAGAIHAVEVLGPVIGHIIAYLISGHHAGLPDWDGGQGSLKFRLDDGKDEYRNSLSHEIPDDILSGIDLAVPSLAISVRSIALWMRLLFSCLVDADFLDTEAYMSPEKSANRASNESLLALSMKFSAGFYPDYTDGCKTAENSKSLFATRRLIRGL